MNLYCDNYHAGNISIILLLKVHQNNASGGRNGGSSKKVLDEIVAQHFSLWDTKKYANTRTLNAWGFQRP